MKRKTYASILSILLFLLTATTACTGSYETKTVFVPDRSESALEAESERILKRIETEGRKYTPGSLRAIRVPSTIATERLALKKILYSFTFNLNELTRDGWEIKSSRRANVYFGKARMYVKYGHSEWGYEHILQKKNGWW